MPSPVLGRPPREHPQQPLGRREVRLEPPLAHGRFEVPRESNPHPPRESLGVHQQVDHALDADQAVGLAVGQEGRQAGREGQAGGLG